MSELLTHDFDGVKFRLLNYLEIGTFYGANLFSVASPSRQQ